jgi:hypothetical protein
VWGGFVDSYLGRAHPTVGTLDPAKATSLNALMAVFDGKGASGGGPPRPGTTIPKIEAWQSAPVYLANGEFLVGGNDREIVMPYTDSTPGMSGGGIRSIQETAAAIKSIAVGPGGTVGWIDTSDQLTLAPDAINLPFGPAAESPPATSFGSLRYVKGAYTSVAWTTGLSAQSTTPPPIFHVVPHLPNVVGLLEPEAAELLAALELPVFVARTVLDPSVPADTVLTQDPPAGVGVACQCAVALTVSRSS